RNERPSNEQQTFYVDIPTEDCVNDDSGAWHNVGEFATETEALAFATEHFGADSRGRVFLVPAQMDERRDKVEFNVTGHPTSTWIAQQLREAFPYQPAPKFLILDHDAKYGLEVPATIRSMRITPLRTSIRSPWQNGVAERWVGSCRRELLDHVIAIDDRHLKRLLSEYVSYHHEDRTHLGLAKQTPAVRTRSAEHGQVISRRRLGGLHHRFNRAA